MIYQFGEMNEAQEAAVYASMGKPVPNPRMDDLRIGRKSTKYNGPWGKHKLFEIVFDIKQSLKKRRSEIVIPVKERVFPIGEHPLIPIQELQPWECFDAARVTAIIAKCIQLLQENNYEAGPDMRLFMDPESVRLITDEWALRGVMNNHEAPFDKAIDWFDYRSLIAVRTRSFITKTASTTCSAVTLSTSS